MGKKIVLDTNVFVSALGWNGAERQLVKHCGAGTFHLVISPDILQELTRVLQYPKFTFPHDEQTAFLALLSGVAVVVYPTERLDVIRAHPQDNIILECAWEGHVHAIISGDQHLLTLKEFRGIRILRAPEFLRDCGLLDN